jgi:hypothetical protein
VADVLLAAGDPTPLGSATPRLTFGEEKRSPQDGVGRRVLFLDDQPAFELSFWCGTCQFLFRRLESANERLSIADLRRRLTDGVDGLDEEVISRFADLLPRGAYLPLLLTVTPRLVHPVQEGDYFAEEQVATWGLDSFWGLPEYPHTPYYRTFDTPVDGDAHLHEFVVPMVPPTWNDQVTVAGHAEALSRSASPTAVAISTLDVCQPAMDDGSTDHHAHWGLTHFLLDGHHKMQAAAEGGRPLQLLSLLSLDGSLATAEQVALVPQLRAQTAATRPLD